MKAIGTVVNKSGKALALFQVKPELFDDPEALVQYRNQLRRAFTHIPLILISMKDEKIIFDGEQDAVQLVQNDALERYHWRGYNI